MKLIIGNKNYSSWSLRAWLPMKVKNIAFEEVSIPLYREESRPRLLTHSPAGKVPTLIDGTLTVWDSLAISEYLAEKVPQAALWPGHAGARARARSICAEMHAGFAALRSQMPMNLRAAHPGKGRTPAAMGDVARIIAIWEDCLARPLTDAGFLFGDFGIADAFFAPVATRFITYAVPLPDACARYVGRVRALPAMQEWYAGAISETGYIEKFEIYA